MKIVHKNYSLALVLISTLACSINTWAFSSGLMQKYIVNAVYNELQDNLLELNDQMIHDYIKVINFIAQEENLDEKSILQDLHTIISDECAYRKENIGNPKDPRTLSKCKWELGTGALGHALIYTAYRFTWKPAQDELNIILEKYQATNPYNVPDATEEDYVRLKDLQQKSPLYRIIFIPLACGFIVPWIHGCIHLYKNLFDDPKHQERYEKLSKIKEHLEAAMQTPY